MDSPPLSTTSSDMHSDHKSKANSQPPLGNALRHALPQDGRYSPPASGTSTPRAEMIAKTRRYLLATADDEEIRQILLARDQQLEHGKRSGGSSSGPRMRDIIFTKRFSTFDRQNPLSADSPFHGFFTLFWLAIALMLIKVAGENWKTYGHPLGRAEVLHVMGDRDLLVLALTDGVMVGSTIVGLGVQRLVAAGRLSWSKVGWVFQNLWQAASLFAIVGWTYYRDWPWTHTIFIVLHTLVFLMKQHSYAFYNGYLSKLYRRKGLLQRKLKELETIEATKERCVGPSKLGSATSIETQSDRLSVTHRPNLGSRTKSDPHNEKSQIGAALTAIEDTGNANAEDMATFKAALNAELAALDQELNGKVQDPAKQYPKNLTIANWADYTILPTLVYELEYPRLERINWLYVAEKTAATLGGIWVMIVVSQAYIYPKVMEQVALRDAGVPLSKRSQELPWLISDLLFPMLLEQLLTWWVIWECILNTFAEVTKFSDRNFYGTWWNSVSWDQYARDWNRPVHNFLLRHVYNSSISSFHLSKGTATFVTFLLSALVHELLMFVIFKKVRGYLFAMQLGQLPLVSLSRTKLLRDRKTLGNIIFWIGLFIGPSMIASLYLIV